VRVLDLTRVIAGPVCTRYLGVLGADVLRLDPPDHPDMPLGLPGDTLLAKRSAFFDLRRTGAMSELHQLLEQADVLVCGYRPGALDVFGLAARDVAERFPGVVIVQLAAWGHSGPWATRRGFDSIVQVASGIGRIESDSEADDAMPGVLPCQLLDHGTGYLAAAAVLDGLRRQVTEGGTYVRRVSLARTAAWLMSHANDMEAPDDVHLDDDDGAWVTELTSGTGVVRAVMPPGRIGATTLRWPDEAGGYGDSAPSFRAATQ
jgi:crotonobetainyl-CoA:carnitine CoA-transferase CaiB-like acyl-CoA transferase